MGQNENTILSVNHFSLEFPSGKGRFTALNDVSFTVKKGEVVALVGESGSGKTALGLSIMRLLGKQSGARIEGRIEFSSESGVAQITTLSEDEMMRIRGRQISMIFQEPMGSLNPAITCGNQISEAMTRHLKISGSEARERVLNLLGEVGIQQPAQTYIKHPGQISGGQQQRVLIAMALAGDPRLLIADEPTTALDASVRRKALSAIKGIQDRSELAMVFITHDLDLALEIADRVIVMYAGKVVEQGTIQDVLNSPLHPYTKGLINCKPPRTGHYYFLPTISDFMRVSSDGKSLEQIMDIDQLFEGLQMSGNERQKRQKRIYSAPAVMKVEHLSRHFVRRNGLFSAPHRFTAVEDVSFQLFPGETLGLIGESGCGKTTLARAIIGLDKGYTGTVQFYNKERKDYEQIDGKVEKGRKVQYIFQDPYASLDPRMTIGAALMEPLNVHFSHWNVDQRKQRVFELLAQVGLKPYHYNRYPHEFSGGQRQRICIARALLLEPEVIVCDEAVSALDLSVQAQVLNLLSELKYEYNLSYLFISHDSNVVRFISDRVLVMQNGRIVEEAETDALYNAPKHEYTRALLS